MARHVLCRGGRSNRYSFGVFATVDAFKLLAAGQPRNITIQAAVPTLGALSHDGNSRNYQLIKYNGQLQGDRAYFHTTRWLSFPHLNISPDLSIPDIPIPYSPSVEKTKFELRLINTQGGFQIHYIMPVQTKGRQVVRLYNRDHHFVQDWLPIVEGCVRSQPAELRALMDRYWLLPDKRKSQDTLRASVMLHYGVHNDMPIFDNYWDETVNIALPFLEEDRKQYLGKISEDFPRGGVYDGREFVKGLSRIAGKKVSVEFKEHYSGDTEAVGLMLLLDEEKSLMDHPEHGTKCCRQFVF